MPEDETKKDEKIPNSLIIYVKTRLPNYYKMTYDPFMTVPKTKSHIKISLHNWRQRCF